MGQRHERTYARMKGGSLKHPMWTESEDNLLRIAFAVNSHTSESIPKIAQRIGRSRHAINCRAGKLGLRKQWKKWTLPLGEVARSRETKSITWNALTPGQQHQLLSARRKLSLKNNGHPRGMLGKHHSEETKNSISNANSGKKIPLERVERGMRTKLEKYGSVAPKTKRGSWKAGWREIGEKKIYARSVWEANYARFLEFQKTWGQITDWQHEPETFWFTNIKRGVRSYLPDFRLTLTNGNIEYHEVKGWMDARSKTKIRRMAKYHPTVILKVIDGRWFKANLSKLKSCVPEWESGRY